MINTSIIPGDGARLALCPRPAKARAYFKAVSMPTLDGKGGIDGYLELIFATRKRWRRLDLRSDDPAWGVFSVGPYVVGYRLLRYVPRSAKGGGAA